MYRKYHSAWANDLGSPSSVHRSANPVAVRTTRTGKLDPLMAPDPPRNAMPPRQTRTLIGAHTPRHLEHR
eukprot:1904209-Prymnesium_polylepis.1